MGMATKRSTTKTAVAKADAGSYVTRAEFLDTRDAILASQAEMKGDIRALGVVLERVDANVRGLAEAVVSTREGLTTKMDDLERRLSDRIAILESVVRQHSVELRQQSEQIRQSSEEIRSLRVAVEGLRHDFDHRPEKAELTALERRVSALEARVSSRK